MSFSLLITPHLHPTLGCPSLFIHRWAQGGGGGGWGVTPLDPLEPAPAADRPSHSPPGAINCNMKNTRDPNLHYLFMTPGNHNVPRWQFSILKCIKRQIYSFTFWPLENLLETLEKISPRNAKNRFFENWFWPPHTHTHTPLPRPHWGSYPATYMIYAQMWGGYCRQDHLGLFSPLVSLTRQLRCHKALNALRSNYPHIWKSLEWVRYMSQQEGEMRVKMYFQKTVFFSVSTDLSGIYSGGKSYRWAARI